MNHVVPTAVRIMELKELNWLCKHIKNVRPSQPCISMNFCTKFSKAHVLPCEIVKKRVFRNTYQESSTLCRIFYCLNKRNWSLHPDEFICYQSILLTISHIRKTKMRWKYDSDWVWGIIRKEKIDLSYE